MAEFAGFVDVGLVLAASRTSFSHSEWETGNGRGVAGMYA
jgi:hypothetical protein